MCSESFRTCSSPRVRSSICSCMAVMAIDIWRRLIMVMETETDHEVLAVLEK